MKRCAALFLLLFVLAAASPAVAADANTARFDLNAFREIPVLHEGRVKPLESFARAYLLTFYGKSALPGMGASAWLAELLFDPERAYRREIFDIPNPDVAQELGLEEREGHRYSFIELSRALDADDGAIKAIEKSDDSMRTSSQRQLLDLYYKAIAYGIISDSFSLFEPRFRIDNQSIADDLHVPAQRGLTFLDMIPHESEIMRNIDRLKDKKPDALTADDKDWISLIMVYAQLPQHEASALFRIVPPQWREQGDLWTAPWATLLGGHGSPQSAAYLDLWKKLGADYRAGDATGWAHDSGAARDEAYKLAGSRASPFRLKLEVLYLRADLFTAALAIYLTSFVVLLVALVGRYQPLRKIAMALMPLGLLLHGGGLVMRIIIMSRPPVSTLYETTIFVSFVAVLLALLFEWKRRDAIGLIAGSIIGSVLLFISTRYAAEGDTMEMLVAVLNTNFWLATHVVAITMGYGCSLVAGTLGHFYLVNKAARPKDAAAHNNILNMMLAVGLIAAFFALLGTILGGIWADQSWGRFWGWDPKENGAMLIVLWLLWLLHGRIASVLSPLNFAACMALTNVVVALSWFGVNLLGVGLHSYGFTSHIALNLALFCGGEIAFVGGMRAMLAKKGQGWSV